jgi:wyosine [tRNA(Phe)-imidazoG37] synthetase (radical SAM superfamily)
MFRVKRRNEHMTAETITVSKSKEEGYLYSLRVEYKTRIVVLQAKTDEEMQEIISSHLCKGVDVEDK